MRWIVRIIVVLLLVALVGVGMLFLLPTERIGQIASDQLEQATGRKLKLSGDFRPTLYPVLGVKTGALTISNAAWAQNPVMIEAAGISVGVGLSALLGGNLEINKLRLEDPVIRLEKAADGRVNWEFEGSSPAADNTRAPSKGFSLALGEIVNGKLEYSDQKSGENIEVSQINAQFSLPKGSNGLTIAGSGLWSGEAVNISADLANLPALLNNGVSALDAEIAVADGDVKLVGMVGLGQGFPTVDGTVSASTRDMAKILARAAEVPSPLQKLGKTSLSGQLQLSSAGLYFDGKATAQLDDLPIETTIEMSGDENWVESLAFDLDTNLTAGKILAMTFAGRVNGPKMLVRGKLDVKSGNPRRMLALLDMSTDLPKGTFQSVAASGKLRVTHGGDIILKKARIALDRNQMQGRVKVKTAGKPLIMATLSANKLDFSGFVSDSGAAETSPETGWSKEPIGLSGLDAANADIELKAKSVNLGVSKLGVVNIKAKLRKGLLTLRLIDVRAFRGAMSGVISLRGGERLSFDSDLLAKDMQLKPLLGQLLGIDRLIGTGTTKMKLAGTGASLHQVMNSLSGSGTIKFANGAFRGIDLAAMMNNLKSAFGGFEGATEFTSMTGSFTLNMGVLENVDLSLISPLFKAEGKGRVSIGGQSMDYVVTPSTLQGDAKISVPVLITGPWDNLKFRPDMDKLINLVLQGKLKDNAAVQKAKEKLAKVKDPEKLVKEKLRKKLAKELGSGGSAEDAVKDQLEEEIGKALFKLFD